MILMGLNRRSRRRPRADRQEAFLRPGHLRQEFRDHDSPAGRPAQQLPTHRRQAPAGARRRSGHAPAARLQLADRHALRLRESEDRRPRRREQSCRDRHAAHRIRHAQQTDRQSRSTTTRPSAPWSRLTIAARPSASSARPSMSKPANGSIPTQPHQRRHRFLLRISLEVLDPFRR